MILYAVLTTAMLGQCVGGSCAYPASSVTDEERPFATIEPLPVEHDYEWLWINHEGLTFPVWGYKTGPKTVRWSRSLKENVEQLQKARCEAAAEKDAQRVNEALRPAPGAPRAISTVPLKNGRMAFDYGVNPDKRAKADTVEHYNGSSTQDIDYVRGKIEAGTKVHVTVIGTPEQRKAVIKDLNTHAKLTPFADQLLVQEYSPGDWAVDPSLGFDNKGTPSILVQLRSGKVIARLKNYIGGPDVLAAALRKADPTYDPAKDPTPAPNGGPSLPSVSKELLLGLGVLALLVLCPGKRPTRSATP